MNILWTTDWPYHPCLLLPLPFIVWIGVPAEPQPQRANRHVLSQLPIIIFDKDVLIGPLWPSAHIICATLTRAHESVPAAQSTGNKLTAHWVTANVSDYRLQSRHDQKHSCHRHTWRQQEIWGRRLRKESSGKVESRLRAMSHETDPVTFTVVTASLRRA